jgi:hypothetical protein
VACVCPCWCQCTAAPTETWERTQGDAPEISQDQGWQSEVYYSSATETRDPIVRQRSLCPEGGGGGGLRWAAAEEYSKWAHGFSPGYYGMPEATVNRVLWIRPLRRGGGGDPSVVGEGRYGGVCAAKQKGWSGCCFVGFRRGSPLAQTRTPLAGPARLTEGCDGESLLSPLQASMLVAGCIRTRSAQSHTHFVLACDKNFWSNKMGACHRPAPTGTKTSDDTLPHESTLHAT